jgi:hypothetical protein
MKDNSKLTAKLIKEVIRSKDEVINEFILKVKSASKLYYLRNALRM